MERFAKHLSVVAMVVAALVLGFASETWSAEVTYERLLNADREPHNWLTYYGNYRGWRYSALNRINTTNVKRLVVKWAFQTGPDQDFQVTPLVVDGVMYLVNEKNHVFALDAATGKMLWRFNYKEFPDPFTQMPVMIWGAGIKRGVSIARGKVLLGTWDAHLIALDAKTGKLLWDTIVDDHEVGYTFTSPPLIVRDKAIIGIMPGEMPNRAHISAYGVDTGKLLWRFYTIPGPGEPGHETWGGDSWQYGCGSAWLPGTYDPELNLFYVGTGNPCPMFYGDIRPGDNLHTNSILALDPDRGTLKWYFQTTPHDVWDFDAMGELVLVDTEIDGRPAKALLQANKNGYLYALERTTGRFLYAKPFVSQINWTRGLDARGRPSPDVVPTPEGAVLCPGLLGAKNWNHTAYSPQTKYLYVPTIDQCGRVKVVPVKPRKGVMWFGGDAQLLGEGAHGLLQAFDVQTAAIRWQYRSKYPIFASVLATGGDLVLTGDMEGNALAFNASTGERLWTFKTGSALRGSPVSYVAGGKQYIAIPSGWGGPAEFWESPVFPELANATQGSTLFVFGLFED
jgi:alcohol dehydrogenase (cytochrome c)